MRNPKNDGVNGCLIPECNRSVRSRGFCDSHYTAILATLKRDKVSWDVLVKAGKALPTKSRRYGAVKDYLKGVI